MFINRYACKNVDLCYMAVRKTQKKHLGKKRKSLSKRKAHSKKKRHSKQRITKKRSHKGGDDTYVYDSVVNPLFLSVLKNDNDENVKNAKNEAVKDDAKEKVKNINKMAKNMNLTNQEKDELFAHLWEDALKLEITEHCPDEPLKKRLIDCIEGKKKNIDGYFSKNSPKVVEFIEDLRNDITISPLYNKFKERQLNCVNIATGSPVSEEQETHQTEVQEEEDETI